MGTDGTTFSVKDQGYSKRRFAIDALKSCLSKLDNEAKARPGSADVQDGPQRHFSFRMLLLEYKIKRAGRRLITCEEAYTSKTCSSCGKNKENLGGSEVYTCAFCGAVMDRDLNGAKNIFVKNVEMLF
uniref:Cas12f1-like TNB domain-containing protein n=1 Tax=Phytophthora ramorum TaxID=164328 RepID=H3GGP6_PHYRM